MSVAVGNTPRPRGAIRVAKVNTPQVTAVAKIKLPTVTEDDDASLVETAAAFFVSVSVFFFFSEIRQRGVAVAPVRRAVGRRSFRRSIGREEIVAPIRRAAFCRRSRLD